MPNENNPERSNDVFVCNTLSGDGRVLFDLDQLDSDWPFEIDTQLAHLYKHPGLGVPDIWDVWRSRPLFYEATPPAHWLMVAEVEGRVLMVPLAPAVSGADRCRPIGCYLASDGLAEQYRKDRR